MKRLVFLVEGDTELLLIHNLVIPYIYNLGFENPINVQLVLTNKRLNKKGGVVSYQHVKNDISRILAQGNVIVTTLIDYFRIPINFPNYTANSLEIDKMEKAIFEDFNSNPNVIPYIQRHEIEALMFSNISGFEVVIDDNKQLNKIRKIIEDFDNPEDINSSPDSSPSKRLSKIFNYNKVADGELIFDAIGIDEIISKCPRFSNWLKIIINKLSE